MLDKCIGDDYPDVWRGPLIGIDWGERRIGVAISDNMLRFAERLAVLDSRSSFSRSVRVPQTIVHKIKDIIKDRQIKGIVFGVPWYHLSGDLNPKSEIFVLVGRSLGLFLDLPVYFWDEGFSTEEVRSRRKMERSGRNGLWKSTAPIDDYAAALVLQSFLDECISSSIQH
ncbi:MAG: Holliday junction resolvase RuvX [Leptospirales bacterium]